VQCSKLYTIHTREVGRCSLLTSPHTHIANDVEYVHGNLFFNDWCIRLLTEHNLLSQDPNLTTPVAFAFPFWRVRKRAKSEYEFRHVCLPVCLSICLSVCLPACLCACLPACMSVRMENWVPTGRIFMKFSIRVFFETLLSKFKFL